LFKADEVEALSAIYGDQWVIEDAVERRFSIIVTDGGDTLNQQNSIQLQVACKD